MRRTVACGLSYLVIATVLWWHAWTGGASTHTLCGCGDPALFLWFFQWPATALAHAHNPFYSGAMFHPGGVNLLAQTSVMGMSVPLIPVTWLFGPVASLNVASTLAPALSAFAMYLVLHRWVRWEGASYVGGLLYGFSPAVLTSLQFAHLMTAAIMVLPLILAVLDDIVLRQRHNPRWSGVALGILVFVQFFMSSEMLAVGAVVVLLALLVLLGAGVFVQPERVRALLPHAAIGLGIGTAVSGVLLAYPVWFALDGPAHLSGLIWANLGAIGGYDGSSFVGANFVHGTNIYTALGGYEGRPLPSSGYLGWGLLAVLTGGLIVWFKDRRLWFFGFLLALCVVCSFGERRGAWEPVRIFAHIPIIENVIVQRFMIIGFLAASVMLAIILDHARYSVSGLHLRAPQSTVIGTGAALALAAASLVPMVVIFGPRLPFAMRPVTLPPWYATVAPHLTPGKVLLSYPAPFSGIQVTLAWQAVNGMSYSQAGGGGPQGVDTRAGTARAGFDDLVLLAFGVTKPPPTPTARVLADVRQALVAWKVNTVVIAPQHTDQVLQQGHPPAYAAAFMTVALGRLPVIEAGAWVWNGVSVVSHPALHIAPEQFDRCVTAAPAVHHATMRVVTCTATAAGAP